MFTVRSIDTAVKNFPSGVPRVLEAESLNQVGGVSAPLDLLKHPSD